MTTGDIALGIIGLAAVVLILAVIISGIPRT